VCRCVEDMDCRLAGKLGTQYQKAAVRTYVEQPECQSGRTNDGLYDFYTVLDNLTIGSERRNL
jgi:hypothetical protein